MKKEKKDQENKKILGMDKDVAFGVGATALATALTTYFVMELGTEAPQEILGFIRNSTRDIMEAISPNAGWGSRTGREQDFAEINEAIGGIGRFNLGLDDYLDSINRNIRDLRKTMDFHLKAMLASGIGIGTAATLAFQKALGLGKDKNKAPDTNQLPEPPPAPELEI